MNIFYVFYVVFHLLSLHVFPPFFLPYVSTLVSRGIARHSNTLPPKMPLLVNGIHKDIYR